VTYAVAWAALTVRKWSLAVSWEKATGKRENLLNEAADKIERLRIVIAVLNDREAGVGA
jgi:hypothetical protein